MKTRSETDGPRPADVPADRNRGAQTERSHRNFPIDSGRL